MVNGNRQKGGPYPVSARFFLWTIRRQDQITHCIVMNMWSAVSTLLVMALIGLVSLQTALHILLGGAMTVGSLIWIFIERRRSWLLAISDLKLKSEAHLAMIQYLTKKLCAGSECRKRLKDSENRWTA